METQIGRSAIGAEQGDGVNSIVATTMVADELAQQIFSLEPGLGLRRCASRLELDEAFGAAGYVLEHAPEYALGHPQQRRA